MDPSELPWAVAAVALLGALAGACVQWRGLRAGPLSRWRRDLLLGLAAVALLLVYCALLPLL